MKKHLQLTICGRVQGVYYRAATKQMADLLGVCGFVKNNDDGSVYAEVEGEEEAVNRLVDWCHHGPDRAVVEAVSIQQGALRGFPNFEIRKE